MLQIVLIAESNRQTISILHNCSFTAPYRNTPSCLKHTTHMRQTFASLPQLQCAKISIRSPNRLYELEHRSSFISTELGMPGEMYGRPVKPYGQTGFDESKRLCLKKICKNKYHADLDGLEVRHSTKYDGLGSNLKFRVYLLLG